MCSKLVSQVTVHETESHINAIPSLPVGKGPCSNCHIKLHVLDRAALAAAAAARRGPLILLLADENKLD